MVVRCLRCRAALPLSADVCGGCGTPVNQPCPGCGAITAAGSSFCENCGRHIDVAHAVLPTIRIRRERKFVSVLFADLRGSLAMIAGTDPETASDILDEALERMRQAVHRFGGMVNRMQGDGMMALFGAPVACEDHAVRACHAALDMLRRHPAGAVKTSHVASRVEIRVGINSGEVITRPVVSDSDVHYGVTGEAVHLAARMEQSAEPGTAYISEATYRLAEGHVEVNSLGLMRIKGLNEPVAVYRLNGTMTGGVNPLSRAKLAMPFVGRLKELTFLSELLCRVEAGRGQAGLLTGEPGTGKSRLVQHFVRHSVQPDWPRIHCTCVPYREVGYSAIRSFVSDALGMPDAPQERCSRRLVDDRVRRIIGVDTAHHASALASLLALPEQDPEWEATLPRDRRQRVAAALSALMAALANRRPVVAIIEDAHYLDETSAAYFSDMLQRISEYRVAVIITSRTGHQPNLPSAGVSALEVETLAKSEVIALAKMLFGPQRDSSMLADLLADATRGNPLYLEQCLYLLAQDGIIARQGDGYKILNTVTQIKVPPGVRSLLASRADQLSDLEKDVLQAASVAGEGISADLLIRVISLPKARLSRLLAKLQKDGFLVAEGAAARVYSFIHGLMRETVYESIPRRSRAALHARLLAALEQSGRATDEALADHAILGEVWDRAAGYLLNAGNRAFRQDFKAEAVRLLRRGLDAAAKVPVQGAATRLVLDLRLSLRNPLFQLGRIGELRQELDAALPAAAAAKEPERVGQWLTYRSHLLWFTGDCNGALQAAHFAMELGVSAADADLRTRARFQEGLIYLTQDRLAECATIMQDVAQQVEAAPSSRYGLNTSLLITARSYLARASAGSGDFKTAQEAIRKGIRENRSLREPFAAIFLLISRGYLAITQGQPKHAIKWLTSACGMCDSADAPLMRPVASAFLALALLKDCQPHDALPIAASAVDTATRIGFAANQPLRRAILADALWQTGRKQDSIEMAVMAMAQAHSQQEPAAERYISAVLSRAGVRPDV